MYTFFFIYKFLKYMGFNFTVTHVHHIGFQWRVHPQASGPPLSSMRVHLHYIEGITMALAIAYSPTPSSCTRVYNPCIPYIPNLEATKSIDGTASIDENIIF